MGDGLWWREEDAAYIRRRDSRYPGAMGIEPEWTLEAAADARRIVRDPDPKSRNAAVRNHRLLAERRVRHHRDRHAIRPRRRDRLEDQRSRPAYLRRTGDIMTTENRRVADEVDAIRAEYAEEESEAAEAEIAERNAALDLPLNLRIDRDLDAQLRQRAAAAQIPVSALVRRLLREAIARPGAQSLTEEQVEQIARRVLNEAS